MMFINLTLDEVLLPLVLPPFQLLMINDTFSWKKKKKNVSSFQFNILQYFDKRWKYQLAELIVPHCYTFWAKNRVMGTESEIKAHLRFLQAVRCDIWPPCYRTSPPPYPTMSDVTYKRNIVLKASVQMTRITLTSYPPFSLPPLAYLSWRILMTLPVNLGPRIHNSKRYLVPTINNYPGNFYITIYLTCIKLWTVVR